MEKEIVDALKQLWRKYKFVYHNSQWRGPGGLPRVEKILDGVASQAEELECWFYFLTGRPVPSDVYPAPRCNWAYGS
jgi:hypothetical protein